MIERLTTLHVDDVLKILGNIDYKAIEIRIAVAIEIVDIEPVCGLTLVRLRKLGHMLLVATAAATTAAAATAAACTIQAVRRQLSSRRIARDSPGVEVYQSVSERVALIFQRFQFAPGIRSLLPVNDFEIVIVTRLVEPTRSSDQYY
ncbi:hypothetical protein V1478_000836 [Vespula squamosa]|uniref:Uncharacterized protein n=1 Tax=Vespula squamosa TaxID=30214 RepID=A0ABD2C777_VESSQ